MSLEGQLTTDLQGLAETLLGGASEGVAIVDDDGIIRMVNPAAEQILGASREALSGRSVFDETWRIADRDGRLLCVDEIPAPKQLHDGVPLRGFECSVQRPDGRRVVLSVNGSPFGLADGSRGAVYYIQDVTARVEAEAARSAYEESSLRFMERSPDAIVIHRDDRVVYANPAVARFLGYDDPAELIGRHIVELTHPDDRAELAARVSRMVQENAPVPLKEERFLRGDGGVFTAEVFAVPVFFRGQPCILAFGHDLAPRHRAEAERQALLDEQTRLREDAQQRAAELRGILDNLTSGLFVCEAGGRITLSNRAAARILGRSSPEELLRDAGELSRMLQLRHTDERPVVRDELPLVRALRGETVIQLDLAVYHPPSRRDRYLRSSAAPIRNERGEVVAAVDVFRDVTDVIEFDRLKDQFIRVVAHELKTPLAILKGYSDLLLQTGEEEPAPRTALEAIGRGTDRIDRIVGDMLDLSQLLVGELRLEQEDLDLAALIEEVAERIGAPLTRHRLRVRTTPVCVRADRARLEQVVLRLLDNAVRYSPRGGDIEVTVARERGWAVVSVRDQGVGIPTEKQTRVFQRFYRAHTDTPYDYGGLGVGLFLSREIVARHGGDLAFESVEGVGSTFRLRLPEEAPRG